MTNGPIAYELESPRTQTISNLTATKNIGDSGEDRRNSAHRVTRRPFPRYYSCSETSEMTTLDDERASWRYLATASIAVVAFTSVLISLAFSLLRPTPPRSVTMATDPEGSFNADLAKHYR